ncbi:acetolactate synthase [Thermoclostridium stercorarium subsp. thermolacticum DSM 2910]|uniref:Acetolactate synthase n=2 Tax=Thermoclostridium stercorarium TaxID=1510 RepID=A0A1B1YL09_THEST|nr:ACT domain-containing protein [Thermoclostridium stercorarium]AGI39565.1 ACT domain-containing protein [Thermoclostridium stercorarium subsp. stercorarium DSM 8532]ANW98899.1 acetolactate synthase [Thermoclostridium stercorarium subsp. thermolacticum DSM 2910]ANX01426.1 acetolactate synthase [Thermoclostridium stercorarium subsp. leptospartum DSM 9219]UZQ84535.1 ACT domain-containing protein [Thermoclostridium stercorarium]
MPIKQISIFLENKQGRLAEVTRILGDNGLDIRALSLADTADYGVLRLIVNDPDRAKKILTDNGFAVSVNDVIAIEIEDRPGGLAEVLAVLDKKGISIEYMYAFVNSKPNTAMVIFRVEDPESALEILKSEDVKIKSPDEVCNHNKF